MGGAYLATARTLSSSCSSPLLPFSFASTDLCIAGEQINQPMHILPLRVTGAGEERINLTRGSRLRVFGINGVHITDASTFRTLIRAVTYALVNVHNDRRSITPINNRSMRVIMLGSCICDPILSSLSSLTQYPSSIQNKWSRTWPRRNRCSRMPFQESIKYTRNFDRWQTKSRRTRCVHKNHPHDFT